MAWLWANGVTLVFTRFLSGRSKREHMPTPRESQSQLLWPGIKLPDTYTHTIFYISKLTLMLKLFLASQYSIFVTHWETRLQ